MQKCNQRQVNRRGCFHGKNHHLKKISDRSAERWALALRVRKSIC